MSGLWIRVGADEVNGERVAILVAELALDPILALGHLVAFSGKVAHHRPEGIIADVPGPLLEQWALWRGAPGAFARVVLERLCDPPGELREWEDTMGDLIRRRRVDRERKAEERRLERAAREAGGTVPPVSADSPRKSAPTGRDGTDGTNGESISVRPRGAGPVADPLEGLPPSAIRLLSLFYPKGRATAKRRRDVLEQLVDTIDPARPGAALDRNTHVKAHDVAQLEEACRRILARPPRDLDLGVRFVLHELTSLEKARRVNATEGGVARAAAAEQHTVAWRKARSIAVAKWELQHGERAAELRAQAEREIPDAADHGETGRYVLLERYVQLAAEAARFPAEEAWKPTSTSAPARRGNGLTRLAADSGRR